MTNQINIVWFKRDLRLFDNAALNAAAAAGHLIALYVVEPELWQQSDTSRRHWHFIHDSLCDLNAQLSKFGGRLIVKIGHVLDVLQEFKQFYGDVTLWSHEETGNAWTFKRDIAIRTWCKNNNNMWHEYPSHGIVRCLKNRDEWAKIRHTRMLQQVIPLPSLINFAPCFLEDDLPAKNSALFIGNVNVKVQQGGRSQGEIILNSFLSERARNYMRTISKPGVSARHCSRLSTHIAYGTLSVREIEQAIKTKINSLAGLEEL